MPPLRITIVHRIHKHESWSQRRPKPKKKNVTPVFCALLSPDRWKIRRHPPSSGLNKSHESSTHRVVQASRSALGAQCTSLLSADRHRPWFAPPAGFMRPGAPLFYAAAFRRNRGTLPELFRERADGAKERRRNAATARQTSGRRKKMGGCATSKGRASAAEGSRGGGVGTPGVCAMRASAPSASPAGVHLPAALLPRCQHLLRNLQVYGRRQLLVGRLITTIDNDNDNRSW